jgi:hypothetical protein
MNGNPDACCDNLVTIPSRTVKNRLIDLQHEFNNPATADHLYWSSCGRSDGFSIIGFPGEFKKDDTEYNKNQLIMVFATAQLQRRALSLKNSIIMGATGCRGRLRIYSSYWNSDSSVRVWHVLVAKSLILLSSSTFTSIRNNSTLPTQLRLYIFIFFVLSLRSISGTSSFRS